MQLNITHLFTDESPFVPFDCSNNRATLGDDAGRLTWQASLETARKLVPPVMETDEQKEAFRGFVCSFGAWSDEEIAAWSDTELEALCLQWIAGDVREAFGDASFEDWDWDQYRADSEAGRIAGRLFIADRGPDAGALFFDISN